jgi:hypothetical protein
MAGNFVYRIIIDPNWLDDAENKLDLAVRRYSDAIMKLGAAATLQLFANSRRLENTIQGLSNILEPLPQSLENQDRFIRTTLIPHC